MPYVFREDTCLGKDQALIRAIGIGYPGGSQDCLGSRWLDLNKDHNTESETVYICPDTSATQ